MNETESHIVELQTSKFRDFIIRSLKPQLRLSPSLWSEKYRRLKPGTTEDKSGYWRNDYFPWNAHVMDAYADSSKDGIIYMKSAQVGGSEVAINLIGWNFFYNPAPVLYLISTDELAKQFSRDRFEYMITSCQGLKDKFLLNRLQGSTLQYKRAIAGKLAILGAQSPNKLMSDPYQFVFIDEIDRMPAFPIVGSAFNLALQRMSGFKHKRLMVWSHPTTIDRGVAQLFYNNSTMHWFKVPCIHCKTFQVLSWENVRIDRERPSNCKYICPHCEKELTDLDRHTAALIGRYESELDADELANRPYWGFHINQLYSPKRSLKSLAYDYVTAQSEANLQVFYNSSLGLPYTSSTQIVTEDLLRERIGNKNGEVCPQNTIFVTMGADVQGREVFYVDISAWTRTGTKYLLKAMKVQGWETLQKLVRSYEVVSEADPNNKFDISMNIIDSGYTTRDVYRFCSNPANKSLPVRYGNVPAGKFVKQDSLPEFGGLWLFHLLRDHWMDRSIGRFITPIEYGGGVVLPLGTTNEYIHHIKANHKIEKESADGKLSQTWEKDRGARDDFLQAATYCEFAAYLKGLDQLSLEQQDWNKNLEVNKEVSQGWVQKGMNHKRRKSGWLRR